MKKTVIALIILICAIMLYADLEIEPGFEYNMVGPAYSGETVNFVSDTLYVTNNGSTEDFTLYMETSDLPEGWHVMWCHDYDDALCHFPDFPWTFNFRRDTVILIDFTYNYSSGPDMIDLTLYWSADGIDDVQMDFTFKTEDYVSSDNTEIPSVVTLSQNYPNPFNPETTISYHLSEPVQTELMIYNIKGELVKSFGSSLLQSGDYDVVWDGKDHEGKNSPSGIYLYRLRAADQSITNKMILMK